jgi:hypothetical protein
MLQDVRHTAVTTDALTACFDVAFPLIMWQGLDITSFVKKNIASTATALNLGIIACRQAWRRLKAVGQPQHVAHAACCSTVKLFELGCCQHKDNS